MKLDLDRHVRGRSRLAVAEALSLDPADAAAELMPARVVLSGTLTVDNLEARVLVHGELTVRAELICDRCLEPFAGDFTAMVEITVIRDAGGEGDDDAWVIHQRSGEVELDEPLRQAAVLSLPLKRLCREECRGLCAGCGANLNLEACSCPAAADDPQWGPLPAE
jgi:uncharacterized protein